MKTCDYNHLLLYAKGHYKRDNRVTDVRQILAERCACPVEYMQDSDIWRCAVHALAEHCPDQVLQVMDKLFTTMPGEGSIMSESSGYCSLDRALYYILSALAFVTVCNTAGDAILELGKPDPNVLPLREKKESA